MGHFRLRGRCAELGPREPRNETSPTVRHFVEIARVSGGSARGLPPARFKETFNDRDPLANSRSLQLAVPLSPRAGNLATTRT